jgi:hypothetical protein
MTKLEELRAACVAADDAYTAAYHDYDDANDAAYAAAEDDWNAAWDAYYKELEKQDDKT